MSHRHKIDAAYARLRDEIDRRWPDASLPSIVETLPKEARHQIAYELHLSCLLLHGRCWTLWSAESVHGRAEVERLVAGAAHIASSNAAALAETAYGTGVRNPVTTDGRVLRSWLAKFAPPAGPSAMGVMA